MSQTNQTSIRLSYEELFYLLRLMEKPNLPGMEKSPWASLTDEQSAMLLEITGRALISRGFIGLDEFRQLRVDPALQAMLHACVHPEQMLVLAYQQGEKRNQHWYYGVKEFAVEQSLAGRWIFQFTITTEKKWGWDIVEALIQSCSENVHEVSFTLDEAVFEKARQLTEEDMPSAVEWLTEQGVVEPEKLAEAIKNATLRLLIQYTYQVQPDVAQDAITLLVTNEANWILNGSASAKKVAIARLPKERVEQILRAGHNRLNAQETDPVINE